jgi:hypothetical protein
MKIEKPYWQGFRQGSENWFDTARLNMGKLVDGHNTHDDAIAALTERVEALENHKHRIALSDVGGIMHEHYTSKPLIPVEPRSPAENEKGEPIEPITGHYLRERLEVVERERDEAYDERDTLKETRLLLKAENERLKGKLDITEIQRRDWKRWCFDARGERDAAQECIKRVRKVAIDVIPHKHSEAVLAALDESKAEGGKG